MKVLRALLLFVTCFAASIKAAEPVAPKALLSKVAEQYRAFTDYDIKAEQRIFFNGRTALEAGKK